ncbi:MAG: hypothetical protein IT445_06075 [Phycisphaeraceae bacterium]|nr:hypothetical protein [Phycisphaeraceae bacterium]
MIEHWFWFLLVVAVIGWYSSVTVYVAIRGAKDIRTMLHDLGERQKRDSGA